MFPNGGLRDNASSWIVLILRTIVSRQRDELRQTGQITAEIQLTPSSFALSARLHIVHQSWGRRLNGNERRWYPSL